MVKVLTFKGQKEELDDEPQPFLYVKPLDLMINSNLLEEKLLNTLIVCQQCKKRVSFKIVKEPEDKKCITFLCDCGINIFYPPKVGRDHWVKSFIGKNQPRKVV